MQSISIFEVLAENSKSTNRNTPSPPSISVFG
jgi:hypothetical protein